jgi:hypothetical protein
VDAGFVWVAFRSEGETAVLPFCVAGPAFLESADVRACRVDFIVAFRLEVVEVFGVFVVGRYASAGGFVGA